MSEGGTQGGAHGFVNLLVQKGEQVAHHHEDGSGKRQQDLPNVQRPLVEVLYPYKNNTTVRNLRHYWCTTLWDFFKGNILNPNLAQIR